MKSLRKLGYGLILSLGLTCIINVSQAFAATATWDGEANDGLFSSGANWVSDVAPSNGDDLVFNNAGTFENDLLTASFSGLTFGDIVTISGNTFTLTGDISVMGDSTIDTDLNLGANVVVTGDSILQIGMSVPQSFNLSAFNFTQNTGTSRIYIFSTISGSGTITQNNSQIFNIVADNLATFTGNIQINDGAMYAVGVNSLGDITGTTTVVDGAKLLFYMPGATSNVSVAEPITIAGDGDGVTFTNYALGFYSGNSKTATFSGNITLTANTTVSPGSTMTLTGAISGTYTLAVAQGHEGTLVVNSSSNTSSTANGSYNAPVTTITLSDSQPIVPVSINYNEIVIIDGVRQAVYVNNGGTLKGTGTVGDLTVTSGGTLAPGHSPGCIISGNLTLNGTLNEEIGGTTVCTGYDQTTVTGTVTIVGATLNTTHFGGFTPAAGNTFTIISNDGADAVTGTFQGLAEAATFAVGAYTYRINYAAGDGNDVVLTTVTVPATPNTGYMMLTNKPHVILLVTVMSTLGMILLGRHYSRMVSEKIKN